MGHPLALWADVAFWSFGQFSSFWMEEATSGTDNVLVLSLGRTRKAVVSRLAGQKHAPPISYQNSMSPEQTERTLGKEMSRQREK